jgi:ketosteroid isomerase-like protein
MPTEEGPLTAIARRYLASIERGASFDELTQFFTEDAVFDEYPNGFTPNGATRDLAGARAAAARGAAIMKAQRYEVDTAIEQGNVVALEVRWTGTLSTAVLTLAAGDEMKARFGVFLTFRDGRIAHSRNYDCFEPW